MTRRAATAFLWFLAVWVTVGALATLAALPAIIGPALGLAAGALVWWDPRGWLWAPRPDRAAVQRRLADLERVPVQAPADETRHETESARG
jgi:hypothetical protein